MLTLREARARRLLTLRDLAEQAGVALSTLYEIEHGKVRPGFRVMRAVSHALGHEPADITEFAEAIAAASQRSQPRKGAATPNFDQAGDRVGRQS
jgi:transcriptional regulator with XRE-family HTH domain